jgi:hypothetical protein
MENKYAKPVVIALAIAIAVTAWYFLSGKASFNNEIRTLEKDKNVENVTIENQANEKQQSQQGQTIKITCKNGESYQIMFTEAQNNYEDLVFNMCGPEGEAQDTTTSIPE